MRLVPFFPTSSGEFPSKTAMVSTIRELAESLPGYNAATAAHKLGGHANRRGGVFLLAALGVPIIEIQYHVRHSSACVLHYLKGATIISMKSMVKAAVNPKGPLLQLIAPPALRQLHAAATICVALPQAGSAIHLVDPSEPSTTKCNWAWSKISRCKQTDAAATCRDCLRAAASAAESESDSELSLIHI